MDHCPIEIWHHVLKFACIDGGITGCSLSLVSKAMASASAPFRFHSIALSGVKQLDKFLDTFLEMEDAVRRIHHLFICDRRGPQTYRDLTYSDLWSINVWSARRKVSHIDHDLIDSLEAAKFITLMPILLRATSNSLETLSLISFNYKQTRILMDDACRVTLPLLTDLSLRLSVAPYDSIHMERGSARWFQTPHLERLNLSVGFCLLGGIGLAFGYYHPFLDLFVALASSSQSLKSIRVSDMAGFDSRGIGAYLAYILRYTESVREDPSGRNVLFTPAPVESLPRIPRPQAPRIRPRIAPQPLISNLSHSHAQAILDEMWYLIESERSWREKNGDTDFPSFLALDPAPYTTYDEWLAEWLKRQTVQSHFDREDIVFRNTGILLDRELTSGSPPTIDLRAPGW